MGLTALLPSGRTVRQCWRRMYDDDELSKCWGVTYLCNDPFQNRIGEVVHPHTQEDPGHRLAPIVVTITQPSGYLALRIAECINQFPIASGQRLIQRARQPRSVCGQQ